MIRKTKIVCTLGPASDSEEMISKLMDAGMNVCRLNMSHGSYEEQGARIDRIKSPSCWIPRARRCAPRRSRLTR